MDIEVKMDRFQNLQNLLNGKYTLGTYPNLVASPVNKKDNTKWVSFNNNSARILF